MSNLPVPQVIITGMHRSGTSLVASMLSNLGVSLGTHVLAADRHKPPESRDRLEEGLFFVPALAKRSFSKG